MSVKFRRAFKVTIFRSCKQKKRKRSSYMAYKFCNGGHVKLDSQLSVQQLQPNGYTTPRNCNSIKMKTNSRSRSGSPQTSGQQHSVKTLKRTAEVFLKNDTEKSDNNTTTKDVQSLLEDVKHSNSQTPSFVTASKYHSYA